MVYLILQMLYRDYCNLIAHQLGKAPAPYRSSISTTLMMGLIQRSLQADSSPAKGGVLCWRRGKDGRGPQDLFSLQSSSRLPSPVSHLVGRGQGRQAMLGQSPWIPCKTLLVDKMPSPLDWDGSRGWGGLLVR